MALGMQIWCLGTQKLEFNGFCMDLCQFCVCADLKTWIQAKISNHCVMYLFDYMILFLCLRESVKLLINVEFPHTAIRQQASISLLSHQSPGCVPGLLVVGQGRGHKNIMPRLQLATDILTNSIHLGTLRIIKVSTGRSKMFFLN